MFRWAVQDLLDERVSGVAAFHGIDKGNWHHSFAARVLTRSSKKQLARWGVRLNTRETERKRKRKDDDRSSSSVVRSTKARTGRASDSDND